MEELPSYLLPRTDIWGNYNPSPPMSIPPFPCKKNKKCTDKNRICEGHKKVLFVKKLEADNTMSTFEIPFGSWECCGWYKDRITDLKGYPQESQRLIYAGRQLSDEERHSGLQFQSTLILIVKPTYQKSARK